jgi:hypothetical protein
MSLRPKDREHLIALHTGPHFNFANVRQVLLKLFQNPRTQFAVRHLAAAEPDCRFHLVAFGKPLTRMLHAIGVIVLVRAGAKLNFLDGNDDLFLLRLVRFFLGEVLKLAIVDDLANRRVSVRRDLDQVHASFSRGTNGVACVHDAEFFTVLSYYAHLRDAYAFVNARGRRATMIRTTAASKTCSYFCTSSVKRFTSQVPSFKLA